MYGKIVWFCWYMLAFAFKIISLGITTCFCTLMGKITQEDRIVIKVLLWKRTGALAAF